MHRIRIIREYDLELFGLLREPSPMSKGSLFILEKILVVFTKPRSESRPKQTNSQFHRVRCCVYYYRSSTSCIADTFLAHLKHDAVKSAHDDQSGLFDSILDLNCYILLLTFKDLA